MNFERVQQVWLDNSRDTRNIKDSAVRISTIEVQQKYTYLLCSWNIGFQNPLQIEHLSIANIYMFSTKPTFMPN